MYSAARASRADDQKRELLEWLRQSLAARVLPLLPCQPHYGSWYAAVQGQRPASPSLRKWTASKMTRHLGSPLWFWFDHPAHPSPIPLMIFLALLFCVIWNLVSQCLLFLMLMDNLKYVGISTSGSQTVTTVFHEIYLLFKKKKRFSVHSKQR